MPARGMVQTVHNRGLHRISSIAAGHPGGHASVGAEPSAPTPLEGQFRGVHEGRGLPPGPGDPCYGTPPGPSGCPGQPVQVVVTCQGEPHPRVPLLRQREQGSPEPKGVPTSTDQPSRMKNSATRISPGYAATPDQPVRGILRPSPPSSSGHGEELALQPSEHPLHAPQGEAHLHEGAGVPPHNSPSLRCGGGHEIQVDGFRLCPVFQQSRNVAANPAFGEPPDDPARTPPPRRHPGSALPPPPPWGERAPCGG